MMFPLPIGPLVIGHRGAPMHSPENTLESFNTALSHGADGLELDLHLTRDGVLVVNHDPVIDGEMITALTFAEFCENSESGISFAQVLEFLGDWPSAYVNIELKHAVPEVDQREARLAHDLHNWSSPGKNRVWVSSFDPHSLLRLHRLGLELPLALIAYEEVHLDLLTCMPVAAVHPHHGLITETRLRDWRGRGLAVFVWTINEPELAREMLAMGMDGIVGDDPRMLVEVRRNSGAGDA